MESVAARENPEREAMVELGERIAVEAAHLDAAMHRLLVDIRAFDAGNGWHHAGAISCAHWLSWRLGWTLSTGREHVRVARRLGELPKVDQALHDGRLSYSKVRAITRVATPATEEALLTDAKETTAAQLETICRKYRTAQRLGHAPEEVVASRRRVVRRELDDGMVRIEAVLLPDEAAIVMAAIDASARRVSAGTPAPTQPRQDRLDEDPADQPAEPTTPAGPAADLADTAADATDLAADLADVPADLAEVPADLADAAPARPDDAQARADAGADASRTSVDVTGIAAGAAAGAESSTVEAVVQRLTTPSRRFDRADGLVALAQAMVRGDQPDRAPVEIVLTVPASALADSGRTGDAAADGDPTQVGVLADGTCVSAETARRLSCDAGVVELVEDANGNPLSVGRRRRTLPVAIKRAMIHRDETCRFPGCTNKLFLDGHHIVHWANGGATEIGNVCALCSRHHTFVHERGYAIEWRDGVLTFLDPRGRVVPAVPPRIDTSSDASWAVIEAANDELAITAETGRSAWDGQPVQYGLVVDDLCLLDRIGGRSGSE